jgi:hypothetical protein
MVSLSKKIAGATLLLCHPILSGFVLLSGPDEARLPAAPEDPIIYFIYEPEAISITEKGDIEGGRYTHYSDSELFPVLIQLAMDRWNSVTGSYLRLQLEEGGNAVFESSDNINSIVFGDANFSTAALAYPKVENKIIVDCDIKVGNRTTTAKSLTYTLIHELGHCIGLGHAHTNYESVMGYSRGSRQLRLGADDKAGIIYLYTDPAMGDTQSKELISCGVVNNGGDQSNFTIGFLLAIPLLLKFIGIL